MSLENRFEEGVLLNRRFGEKVVDFQFPKIERTTGEEFDQASVDGLDFAVVLECIIVDVEDRGGEGRLKERLQKGRGEGGVDFDVEVI